MDSGVVKAGLAASLTVIVDIVDGPAVLLLNLLMLLMILDYAFGFSCAWQANTISRKKMMSGAVKIVLTPVAVLIVAALDYALRVVASSWTEQLGLSFFVPLRDFFLLYLCVHEGLSCLEHLASLGVPIPKALLTRLSKYRDAIDKNEQETGKEDKTDGQNNLAK